MARTLCLHHFHHLHLVFRRVLLMGEAYRIGSVDPDRSIEKRQFAGVFVFVVGLDEFRNVPVLPHVLVSSSCLLMYLAQFFFFHSLHDIRGYTHPLTVTAQMFPLVPGGFCAALLVPYLIKKFPGHIIFLFAMFGFMCANLFMATAPVNQVYWANTFVGMLLGMFGPDLSFSTGQLIVSNSVDRNLQGIAAGIVSMITNYSCVVLHQASLPD